MKGFDTMTNKELNQYKLSHEKDFLKFHERLSKKGIINRETNKQIKNQLIKNIEILEKAK